MVLRSLVETLEPVRGGPYEPLFLLLLADDPAVIAALEGSTGWSRLDAADWFIGTDWGDALPCRRVVNSLLPDEAALVEVLRAAWRQAGIA